MIIVSLPSGAAAGLPPAKRVPYVGHVESRPDIAVRFDIVIREGHRRPRIKFDTDRSVPLSCDDGTTEQPTSFDANLSHIAPRRFYDYYDYGGGDEWTTEWYEVRAQLLEGGKARGFGRYFVDFHMEPTRTCDTGKVRWVAKKVGSSVR